MQQTLIDVHWGRNHSAPFFLFVHFSGGGEVDRAVNDRVVRVIDFYSKLGLFKNIPQLPRFCSIEKKKFKSISTKETKYKCRHRAYNFRYVAKTGRGKEGLWTE